MAGGMWGAAGFLPPSQGEQQALSDDGCRMGRTALVLPSALLPASAQEDMAESVWSVQGPPRGRRKQPLSRQWALLFPRDEEEEATVQQKLRKNRGLCLGVAEGQWGGAEIRWRDSCPQLLGLLVYQALG